MNRYDIFRGFRKVAEDQSKIFNGDETINYPYAFGALSTQLVYILDDLNLTDEQMKVLKNRLEREQDKLR